MKKRQPFPTIPETPTAKEIAGLLSIAGDRLKELGFSFSATMDSTGDSAEDRRVDQEGKFLKKIAQKMVAYHADEILECRVSSRLFDILFELERSRVSWREAQRVLLNEPVRIGSDEEPDEKASKPLPPLPVPPGVQSDVLKINSLLEKYSPRANALEAFFAKVNSVNDIEDETGIPGLNIDFVAGRSTVDLIGLLVWADLRDEMRALWEKLGDTGVPDEEVKE